MKQELKSKIYLHSYNCHTLVSLFQSHTEGVLREVDLWEYAGFPNKACFNINVVCLMLCVNVIEQKSRSPYIRKKCQFRAFFVKKSTGSVGQGGKGCYKNMDHSYATK